MSEMELLHAKMDDLIEKVGELTVKVALLEQSEETLKEQMAVRDTQVTLLLDVISKRIAPIEKAATQYAAIFAFILAMGGFFGWAYPFITKFFK